MAKIFVIGDIHGAHIPLQQCLDRCGFDYENDTLITLGDICDGWSYVYECVEILLRIKTINLIGNHDEWFHRWLKTGRHPDGWRQGGKGTKDSYLRAYICDDQREHEKVDYTTLKSLRPYMVPSSHKQFFENQQWYYKDSYNRLFVHGGILKEYTLEENAERFHDDYYFHWNRLLWDQALCSNEGEPLTFTENFSEIYIGHTQTTMWTRFRKAKDSYVLIPTQDDECPPMKADIVYNLDTGAGSNGKLTIMDVDTHEYWQSDPVNSIYGAYKPRG